MVVTDPIHANCSAAIATPIAAHAATARAAPNDPRCQHVATRTSVTKGATKIGVCVKQVPAKDAPLAIDASGAWIRESDISFETNEPDSFALEEALRLKEKHGGEVVAISMGPERAKQTIKEALAKGAERGIHVVDDKFYALDPLGSARSLAAAIQKENFDLILTGLQSEDHGFGQTGVLLAELLGRPHATSQLLAIR